MPFTSKFAFTVIVVGISVCLIQLTEAASFLRNLEKSVETKRLPRHAWLDSITLNASTFLAGSSSESGSEEIHGGSNATFREVQGGEQMQGEEEDDRKKRNILTQALLAHPIVINVNGTNFTYYGSSLSSLVSDSSEFFTSNGTNVNRLYGSYRDKRSDEDRVFSRKLQSTSDGQSPVSQVLLDLTNPKRKKRHTIYVPDGHKLFDPQMLQGHKNGTIIVGSFSTSAESDEYPRIFATTSSTTTPTTTGGTTVSTEAPPSLDATCCRNTTCVTYGNILLSCTRSQLTRETCMASLRLICTRFQSAG